MQQTHLSPASFNFTGVSDNRSSIPANDKIVLDTPVTLASITASTHHELAKTTVENGADTKRPTAIGLQKSPTSNDPHAKSDKMESKDRSDSNAEMYAANGADDDSSNYYYDDDYEYKNDDSDDSIVNIATSTPTPMTTLSEQLAAKPMGTSTDDDVIKVFGRYMTIDTDKLLKKEQMLKNKKLKNLHDKSGKPPKKHYIPMPLLEPQSPSLADDEVEIDIMLPTTKNDHPTKEAQTEKRPAANKDKHADDDEVNGEPDPMAFYSNEDVLTTKELIDDMARIMKNGAEIRRNQMNHKAKYVRKSHGACFTGADR